MAGICVGLWDLALVNLKLPFPCPKKNLYGKQSNFPPDPEKYRKEKQSAKSLGSWMTVWDFSGINYLRSSGSDNTKKTESFLEKKQKQKPEKGESKKKNITKALNGGESVNIILL